MNTFQTCIQRRQSAGLLGLIPDVAAAHGMARTGGRFLSSLLGHGGQAFFLLFVFKDTLCLYSLQQKLSMDKRMGVSALLSPNKPAGIVRRVNSCKRQLYSLSYRTWDAAWSVVKSVRIFSVAFDEFGTISFLLMLTTLVRELLCKWKNNSFSIFATCHVLAVVRIGFHWYGQSSCFFFLYFLPLRENRKLKYKHRDRGFKWRGSS